ncbi:helicase-related protein, partial [Treponema endosymbiont of Eucomonympha sp.]|uniref:helicase-related protein n=1 Tax=Treponema endosymbiont of Eucomonympha sp. TaxID=1580831 RepID=UPI000A471887
HYSRAAPIVPIATVPHPGNVVDDPSAGAPSTLSPAAADALLKKIAGTVERVLAGKESGAILCFLPGEKIIKVCLRLLASLPFGRRLWLLPLYGRLSKEDQERVFASPPSGRKKLILSTNIAEPSVTIADVTAVIDTGLA